MQKPRAAEKHKYQVTSAKTLATSSTALFFSFGLPSLYIAKKNEKKILKGSLF
jgi:hypothetical protein